MTMKLDPTTLDMIASIGSWLTISQAILSTIEDEPNNTKQQITEVGMEQAGTISRLE